MVKRKIQQMPKAAKQLEKNGDCIAEGELGDAVTVSVGGGSNENT